jgi:hypothetical protein
LVNGIISIDPHQRGAGEGADKSHGKLMQKAMLSAGPYLSFSTVKYELTNSLEELTSEKVLKIRPTNRVN